ncbi:MAG: hypothetical protein R2702_15900 [Acidimicrobiales bacterium]
MRVHSIERTTGRDGIEWSGRISFADQERTVRFGGPAELVSNADATPFLAAALLPAMAWGQDLHVDGPVSGAVVAKVPTIARLLASMDPALRVPEVSVAEEAEEPWPTGDGGVACMFSRGVDSTYSASVPRGVPAPRDARRNSRTRDPNHDEATAAAELEATRRAAEVVGLPLHAIWTDLRAFTDPMFGWSAMHGAGLAALALLVRQRFDHVVLPSAYDLESLAPAGSHPAIDPLWSSPSTRIHHDHLDRGRHAKVAWLAAERPDLLPHLKVCYQHSTQTNCGQCHKCGLTMSSLRAEGVLGLATLFPAELDLEVVRRQRVVGPGSRGLWVPIARRAREVGDDELADALEDMLRLSAVPTLRELLSSRSKVAEQAFRTLAGPPRFEPYDPERATTFERFDRAYTDAQLGLIRHGEVRPLGTPPPTGLRASTLVASLAASVRHRRRRR